MGAATAAALRWSRRSPWRRARQLGAVAGLLLLASPAALADDDEESPYARKGTYFGLGFAATIQSFQDLGFVGFDSAGSNWGYNAFLGYRFHERVAAEVDVSGGVNFPLTIETPPATFQTTSVVPMLDVRGYLLTGRWQPYLTAGVGAAIYSNDIETAGFAVKPGVGIDLYGNEWWVVNIEGGYVLPVTGSAFNLQYGYISFGLQWRL